MVLECGPKALRGGRWIYSIVNPQGSGKRKSQGSGELWLEMVKQYVTWGKVRPKTKRIIISFLIANILATTLPLGQRDPSLSYKLPFIQHLYIQALFFGLYMCKHIKIV